MGRTQEQRVGGGGGSPSLWEAGSGRVRSVPRGRGVHIGRVGNLE